MLAFLNIYQRFIKIARFTCGQLPSVDVDKYHDGSPSKERLSKSWRKTSAEFRGGGGGGGGGGETHIECIENSQLPLP